MKQSSPRMLEGPCLHSELPGRADCSRRPIRTRQTSNLGKYVGEVGPADADVGSKPSQPSVLSQLSITLLLLISFVLSYGQVCMHRCRYS